MAFHSSIFRFGFSNRVVKWHKQWTILLLTTHTNSWKKNTRKEQETNNENNYKRTTSYIIQISNRKKLNNHLEPIPRNVHWAMNEQCQSISQHSVNAKQIHRSIPLHNLIILLDFCTNGFWFRIVEEDERSTNTYTPRLIENELK